MALSGTEVVIVTGVLGNSQPSGVNEQTTTQDIANLGGTGSGNITPATVVSSGKIVSTGGTGNGYATGAGGVATQLTDRSTGVVLSKLSGAITTNNASLAAETAASFTVTNTLVAISDVVVVSQRSGSNGGNTNVCVSTTAAGSFVITVANNNAAAGTAETGAIIINFAIMKAVAA